MTKAFNIFAAEDSEQADLAEILVGQGLVTHIAVIEPMDAALSDIARFRQDAARKAATVITLGPGRFGLALSPSARLPISDVPHRLEPADAAAIGLADAGLMDLSPLEPALLALEGRLATVERACAPETLAQTMQSAVSSAMSVAVEDIRALVRAAAEPSEKAVETDDLAPVTEALGEIQAAMASLQGALSSVGDTGETDAATLWAEGEERLAHHVTSQMRSLEERLSRTANGLAEVASDRHQKLCTQLAEQDARRDDVNSGVVAQLSELLQAQTNMGRAIPTTAGLAKALRSLLLPDLARRFDAIDRRLTSDEGQDAGVASLSQDDLTNAILTHVAPRLDALETHMSGQGSSAEPAHTEQVRRLDEICARLLEVVAQHDAQTSADLQNLQAVVEAQAQEAAIQAEALLPKLEELGSSTITATDVTVPIVEALHPKLAALNDSVLAHLSHIATSLGSGSPASSDPGQIAASLLAQL